MSDLSPIPSSVSSPLQPPSLHSSWVEESRQNPLANSLETFEQLPSFLAAVGKPL